MCNSVVFCVFTELYNCYYLKLEHSHHPKKKCIPISSSSLTVQTLNSSQQLIDFPVSMDLLILNFIDMESIIGGLLCLASFT